MQGLKELYKCLVTLTAHIDVVAHMNRAYTARPTNENALLPLAAVAIVDQRPFNVVSFYALFVPSADVFLYERGEPGWPLAERS